MKRTRILIADDHPLIRELLNIILEPEFHVVGAAEDAGGLFGLAAIGDQRELRLRLGIGFVEGERFARQRQSLGGIGVEQFLAADGWYPQAIEGTTAYRSGFNGDSGKFRVISHVNVELEQLYLYVVAEVNVPEDSRPAVAEFITRANYGMRIGNFELDLNDGEVRYKSSLDFEGQPLTARLVHNAIYPAVTTMDRYFPSLMKVAYGGATAAEAVEEIERPQPPPA